MKRFAIYFFYDQDGIVDDYNIYMLEDLKNNIDHLMVVSNGPLNEEVYKKFTKVSDEIFERDNKGFDVWAYKEGILKAGWNLLEQYDELILLNFTNFGPIYPFKDMFDEMHQYYERGYTPKAKKKKACYVCSLKDLCLPELEKTGNVETYMNNILAEDLEDNT